MDLEPGQKDKSPEADKGTTTEHNQNADVTHPLPVVVTNFPPAQANEEISHRQRSHALEQRKYRVEKITLGVLLLYTSVAAYQAWLTRRAVNDSKESAARILEQTKLQTKAQQDAAKDASDSIKVTRDSIHLDQRAWVAAVGTTGTPEVDKPFEITVDAHNSGKTFAKDFNSVAVTEPVPRGGVVDFNLESKFANRNSISIIAPNAEYLMKLHPLGSGDATARLPKSKMDDIQSGNVTMFVFGTLTYKDIFNCHHWTKFCFRLTKQLTYESCDTHNEADENTCPVTDTATKP